MSIDWAEYLKDVFEEKTDDFEKTIQKADREKEINDEVARFIKSLDDGIKQKAEPDPKLVELFSWLKVLIHPLVILILGGRGWGKSALGYKIAEYLKGIADVYVVGLPRKARRQLPDWIGSVPSIEDVPPNAIVIIDESYNLFHARTSSSERSRILSNIVNLSRQREQTLIFITQEARQVDKNISSSANVIIFKNPGMLQFEFERKEIKGIAEKAREMFTVIGNKDKPRWSYVYAPESDFEDMLENSLPEFWSPGLSKAYADSEINNETKNPRKMTREEKIRMTKELKKKGWTDSQMATYFGVSKSTIHNWLHDYPYRK